LTAAEGIAMTRYAYQCKDSSGNTLTGAMIASSIDEAQQMIRKDGKIIISLREDIGEEAPKVTAPPIARRIKRDDVIFFSTQLAVMVETGVPLADALSSIIEQTVNPAFKAVLVDVYEQVKAGTSFSDALEKYPKLFGDLFVALMRASEASGTMGPMLQRASQYLQQERETRKQVKGAMTYPVCMLSFCVMVVIGLLTFVMPRFEKIYSGKGAVLPAPTRILMGFSGAIVSYWPFIIVGLAGLVAGMWWYFRTPTGRIRLDRIKLATPIIGGMYHKVYLARSLRTMATMVSSGVAMLDGLAITAQASGSHCYEGMWKGLIEDIKQGSTLSDKLFQSGLVPRTIAQMIYAGEKTGKLATVMNRAAAFCEDDLRVAVKTVTSMIEPAMIIVMGAIVGGIAISLLMPVFSISRIIAH